MADTPSRCRIVVLISGRGSNLEAILRAVATGELPVEVTAVISNRPEVTGLDIARRYGVPNDVVDHRSYADRVTFDRALKERIDRERPDLVVLAGFMRVLGPEFINHYAGRLINIHPSLLPAFPGLKTHERAIESGAKQHGATVHFVTADVDCGPIIAQAAVSVLPEDSPESLARRVLEVEHRLYPQAIRWFAEGRLSLRDGRVQLDDHPVPLIGNIRGEKT